MQAMDDNEEGQIISCLQDSQPRLMNLECRDQVHKVMVRGSEDIRFNQLLADACLSDREQFCGTTQQVQCAWNTLTDWGMVLQHHSAGALCMSYPA